MENGIYEVGCLCVIPEYQKKRIGTSAIEFIKKYYDDWKKFTLITPMDKSENIKKLINPGVILRQLLNPDNSESKRVTVTEVHLEVGASQPRHIHDSSEQIWYAIKGTGKLLLSDDNEKEFKASDVVRFADKDVHGLFNDGETEFIYISVTAPPVNFGYAYQEKR